MRYLALAPIVVACCASLAHADLLDGLVLYLPLDESAGRAAADLSPTDAASSVAGTATWEPGGGAFGGALDLSGARDGGVATAHDFGTLESATVAAWTRLEDPEPARWDYLFDTRSRDVDVDAGATYLGRNRDAAFRFGDFEAGPDTYPRGVWTHIVLSVDSRKTKLYVDGELVEQWDGSDLNIGDRLTLGNRHTFADALHGALDEVAIWARVLDAAEVRTLTTRAVMTSRAVAPAGKAALVWAAVRGARAAQ
ncbi:LamG domain-containing protein [Candidatus Poribacteria bacterium]|jgi:hypothetical protein|nr:LamG domain-containing protein [Candidatus Poribacteria bacterium]MBT5535939.1 LamG domain-containing protein [Candidatus Poribacteria bacterium]MBT5712144.1 LamG domain-containing protein [Candidatus Poribacteria bacterium]MBT7099336.1 LamG domain-containing protein [Candidatus Poribacteria bacterium]MBT7805980.1 LamG domain-containing protein [Candidatus Poribacteria bacterium]